MSVRVVAGTAHRALAVGERRSRSRAAVTLRVARVVQSLAAGTSSTGRGDALLAGRNVDPGRAEVAQQPQLLEIVGADWLLERASPGVSPRPYE